MKSTDHKIAQIKYYLGLDVGSTTIKIVVLDVQTNSILYQNYKRHETQQLQKTFELLKHIETIIPDLRFSTRIVCTGSGGNAVGKHINAKFVQEVHAVSLAVEKLYPQTGSVIELGGQDAKIIIFQENSETGRKKKIPSMNDKCAGGTGAVIDKISAKLKISADQLCEQKYTGIKLHPVAGKCGVFAETDINGLQKQGIPQSELMASLFEAIVLQNLSVLTRGHTLKPSVLLLGGPNTYIVGMQECWRENILKIWTERNTKLPTGIDPKSLIFVPENAQFYAAIGAIEFAKIEPESIDIYAGFEILERYILVGVDQEKSQKSSGALFKNEDELKNFKKQFTATPFESAKLTQNSLNEVFIGLDAGSTSTKAVLMDAQRNVIAKAYQLSNSNPIQDMIDVFAKLENFASNQNAKLKIMGVGVTGYAKDILKSIICADTGLVETVAHTKAALHYYPQVDVIVDVGGQDIKVIILQNGQIKDFKLNTQCSAGNGYFLQNTAEGFGHSVNDFANLAFSAKNKPNFGFGCAVFMQTDIVAFQRQGWSAPEILAGLATVLPKNIWLYICQIPNLARLGTRFVLQGGTQYNLAAVKAQVDFIESHFQNQKGIKPDVFVHKFNGESGAIGAALEAIRLYENGKKTTFIGLEEVAKLRYTTQRDESTRCHFCKNKCLRTFIHISKNSTENSDNHKLILSTCEKGSTQDTKTMLKIRKEIETIKKENTNFVDDMAKRVFESMHPKIVKAPLQKFTFFPYQRKRNELIKKRENLRIGIPRVLNMYSMAPLFSAYFESLGIQFKNIIYSDYTTTQLYKDGSKRGSIDPCFPSKLGIPHVHNLIYTHHVKKSLDVIFFPMIDSLPTSFHEALCNRACPTVQMTPAAVKAAFTKETDIFKHLGIIYCDTFCNIAEPNLFARQMFHDWKSILGLNKIEHNNAIMEGYSALDKFYTQEQKRAEKVLHELEINRRIGIVLLGRSYHNDPGINHGIIEEFQKLGYPILTQDCLPIDAPITHKIFKKDLNNNLIKTPTDISDVWKNSYNENTNRKIWAAKFVARHPNLVALELSNFKCGHDAPIYNLVEDIIESSGTPYFSFKDIDENKSKGSIKLRIETINYFLKQHQELLNA